jgi:exo-beta-1,3-glucanase (GH17 family)
MEKIAKFLPLSLFCVFSLKLMVLGAQLVDSLVLLVLAAYSAYYEFKAVDSKIKVFEEKINNQELLIKQKSKEIDEVKALVGGIKLGQQLKSGQNRI